jgi:NitT/TauT family transport system permease protein
MPLSDDQGVAVKVLDQELSGLDALAAQVGSARSTPARVWSAIWPKLAAIILGLLIWQAIVWSGWKPEYALPPPGPVFRALWQGLCDGSILNGAWLTLRRAAVGYSIALVIGIVVGLAIARVKVLRIAFGSLITGIQTMPSIAWFPLAILLFQLSESAILFVVVIGAAPAIANGMIAGADNVPPLLLRAGRMLDAKGFTLWRYVILPASLPTFVSGMKQGWAFAWRSLLAGELLVIIKGTPSLGVQLQVARDFADAPALLAVMIVILVIGILADAFVFGALERAVRRRFGLTDSAS